MDAALLFVKNYAKVRFEDLPPAVVTITKHEILDTLGVAAAGAGQPGAKEVMEMVCHWGGREESSIIGSKQMAPAPNAARVNAVMAHARDYDDVHETAVMHPGIVTVLSGMAAGELAGGVSGKDFLANIATGVDMICRLGLASRPGVSPIHTGWHYTTMYGYPTAAMTAGKVMGLTEEQMIHAFGLAYHQCSGNAQAVIDGSLAKRLGPANAIYGGMVSALMAQRGVTGARNSLEGEQGLYQVYHQGHYDRDVLTRDLGRHFEGVNVTLKPYPCCRGVHASIDAAIALSLKYAPDLERVQEIVLTTGDANHRLLCTPPEQKLRPRNPVDAQFSIPWGVALGLLRRRVSVDDFTAAAIDDPDALRLTSRLRTEIDPALSSPRGTEPARLKVTMADGESYVVQVDLAKGSPGQPMTYADCVEKFKDCAALANMRAETVERIINMVGDLENIPDASAIMKLLT